MLCQIPADVKWCPVARKHSVPLRNWQGPRPGWWPKNYKVLNNELPSGVWGSKILRSGSNATGDHLYGVVQGPRPGCWPKNYKVLNNELPSGVWGWKILRSGSIWQISPNSLPDGLCKPRRGKPVAYLSFVNHVDGEQTEDTDRNSASHRQGWWFYIAELLC